MFQMFNQKYGQSKKLKAIGMGDDPIYWENEKEIAYFFMTVPGHNEYHLVIIDKESYKAMVRFVAQEVRKIATEQEAEKKAKEEAIKGGI